MILIFLPFHASLCWWQWLLMQSSTFVGDLFSLGQVHHPRGSFIKRPCRRKCRFTTLLRNTQNLEGIVIDVPEGSLGWSGPNFGRRLHRSKLWLLGCCHTSQERLHGLIEAFASFFVGRCRVMTRSASASSLFACFGKDPRQSFVRIGRFLVTANNAAAARTHSPVALLSDPGLAGPQTTLRDAQQGPTATRNFWFVASFGSQSILRLITATRPIFRHGSLHGTR